MTDTLIHEKSLPADMRLRASCDGGQVTVALVYREATNIKKTSLISLTFCAAVDPRVEEDIWIDPEVARSAQRLLSLLAQAYRPSP